MKTHDEVMGLLPRYERLEGAERAEVDEHVRGCPACASRLAILQYAERDREQRIISYRQQANPETAHARRALHLSRSSVFALAVVALAVVAWAATSGQSQLIPHVQSLLHPAAPARSGPPAPTPLPPPTVTPEPTVDSGASPEGVAWLKQHAIPFRSAEPGADMGDLEPLRGMIGTARVVVFDDTTFGSTHEALAVRQRLLEFLVERMGFSQVMVETTWDEAAAIDTYIQGGSGVPETLATDPRDTSPTQEYLYTLRWLRTHNGAAGRGPRVTFSGFLPGTMPDSTIVRDAVRTFLDAVDPGAQLDLPRSAQQLRDWLDQRGDEQLVEWLAAHSAGYVARSSQKAYDHAFMAAQVLSQAARLQAAAPQQRGNLSQSFLAQNLKTLLDSASEERVIIWRSPGQKMLASWGNDSYLRTRYGDQAFFVTLAFYNGSVYHFPALLDWTNVPSRSVHTLGLPPAGSQEAYLHTAGLPRFVLDLRAARNSGEKIELPIPGYVRSLEPGVDECFPENGFTNGSMLNQGDALVFFDHVTPPSILGPRPAAGRQDCPRAPRNLDFSRWLEGWQVVKGTADRGQEYEIEASEGRLLVKAAAASPNPQSTGGLYQVFRADDYRGQRVRLSVNATTRGAIAPMICVNGTAPPYRPVAQGCQMLPGAVEMGSFAAVMEVPQDAIAVSLTIQLSGPGQVEVTDLRFETVGRDVPTSVPWPGK